MRTVRAAARGEVVVSIAVKAEGWKSGFGAFGYAVVDDRGKTIDEGELAPGKDVQLACPDGTYAVSITSFPSMKGKKATWAPPASTGKGCPACMSRWDICRVYHLISIDEGKEGYLGAPCFTDVPGS